MMSNWGELERDVYAQVEWLLAILQSIHDGVLVIDDQEIVRLVNPEYTNITGVEADEIIGKRLRDVRPNAQLPETLRDGRVRVGVYRKEGEKEYVVDMAPIIVNHRVIGAVSICKGLTEVHKLARELKRNKEKLSELKRTVDSIYQAKYTFQHIVGRSRQLTEMIRIAKRAAESDLPVLIMGESGTGKELFAQAIHQASARAERPFVPVNCAAIPDSLLESELFGYVEGSFTHAKKGGKIGLFELADKGTIFLDEIGDLPYDLQAKLLRVLQEKTIRKVGDTREKAIDVRIIAATNKDLHQLVMKQYFREDLFYRLHVITLHLPPLRERKEDIPVLIESMLQSAATSAQHPVYSLSSEALALLQSYDWPGNIRELKNAIDYAICMTDKTEIHLHHLPPSISKGQAVCQPPVPAQPLKKVLEETERRLILETLHQFGSDVEGKRKTAKALGMSLATLYNKLKKLGIIQTEQL
ncbi:sigma-54 interaction domain-containing protein [Geobacillus subterraneus]|uniref:sigma-54 interaction domain-containing protein n=1 Tax=Geobacillus subterraneus TaxID=129338 RepID=UPI001622A356